MRSLSYFGLSLFWWLLFYFCFRKDRSRYRNCYLLFIALAATLFNAVLYSESYINGVVVIVVMIILLAVLIVPFFLIFSVSYICTNRDHHDQE